MGIKALSCGLQYNFIKQCPLCEMYNISKATVTAVLEIKTATLSEGHDVLTSDEMGLIEQKLRSRHFGCMLR